MQTIAWRGHWGSPAPAQYTGVTLLLLLAWLPVGAQPSAAGSHTVTGGAGAQRVALPSSATAGFVEQQPGVLRSALATANSVDLIGGGLDYRYTSAQRWPRWLDPAQRTSLLTYRLAWARFSGDQTTAATVPQGGAEVGLIETKTFAPPAPALFFGGPAGLSSRARVKVDNGRLEAGLSWLQQTDWLSAATSLQPALRLGWTQLDYYVLSEDAFLDATLPPTDFNDDRDQRLQHDIFDFTLSARLEQFFGADERVSVFTDIGASLYFLKATLVSYEFVTQNGVRRRRFTGGGEREFSLGGEVTVGAIWRLGRGVEAQAALQHRPWVPTGIIGNPLPSGAGSPTTVLGTTREAQTTATLRISYRFGDD